MDKIYVVTIEEEFEKSQVKGFIRTKKGKMERVNPFARAGGAIVNLKHAIHPGIHNSRSDVPTLNDVGKHLEGMGYKKVKEGWRHGEADSGGRSSSTEYQKYKHSEGHTAHIFQSESSGATFARMKGPKEHHEKFREAAGMKPDRRLKVKKESEK